LQEFLTEADLDGDGNVNYEEFIILIFKKSQFQDRGQENKSNDSAGKEANRPSSV